MEQEKYEEKLRRDEAKSRNKSTWSWLSIIGLFLIAGGFYFFFVWQPQSVPQVVAAIPPSIVITPAETEPDIQVKSLETQLPFEQENTIPEPLLPELDNSNEFAIEALGRFYPGEEWLKWVTTDEALRKFVVVVDNIAAGKVAQKYISIPKPSQKFKVEEIGDKEYLQPVSYDRYNQYIDIFSTIDTDLIVSTYRQFSPLLEQAFAELGYPDKTFHTSLLAAIEVMLDTPAVPEGKIELTHTSVVYKYKDPELEGLPAVQKQMLRMGPRNTAIVREKLQALKLALSQ